MGVFGRVLRHLLHPGLLLRPVVCLFCICAVMCAIVLDWYMKCFNSYCKIKFWLGY